MLPDLQFFPQHCFKTSIIYHERSSLYRLKLTEHCSPERLYRRRHNQLSPVDIDLEKHGLIAEVMDYFLRRLNQTDIEVNADGNILKDGSGRHHRLCRDCGQNGSAASFIAPRRNWFHNNAATYKQSDDSLLISSTREFRGRTLGGGSVAILSGSWATMKHSYQFPSLQQFALGLDIDTLPPIGEVRSRSRKMTTCYSLITAKALE